MTITDRARNNASIYLSIYLSIHLSFTPHLSHPGSRVPCTPWNTLCISVWHVQLHALKDDWSCHEDYQQRQVSESCTDTWYKWTQLLRQWSCSCPVTCQHACENQKQLLGLLYCGVHIDKGATLNLLQCLRVVCECRAVQTNSAENCCICSYSVTIIISSGSLPIFLECNNYSHSSI